MREYKEGEVEIVKQMKCVMVQCDMCKSRAEHPNKPMPWEWGGIGGADGELSASWTLEGDGDSATLDLCYECASWLIDQIKLGTISRTAKAREP